MKNLFKVIIGASVALIGFTASAVTPAAGNNMFFGSKDSDGAKCEAAVKNGTAQFYKPVGQSAEREARLAKTSQRPGEANACFLMETMNGRQWVAMPKHTLIQTNGPTVMYLTECGNTIYNAIWIPDAVVGGQQPPRVHLPDAVTVAPSQFAGLSQSAVSVPGLPREGVVYSDGNGNTFQSEQLGSRQCNYALNGKVVETIFAPNGLDDVQSKKYCDVYGEAFKARHRPTTPSSGRPQASPAAYNVDVSSESSDKTPAAAPAAPVVATSSEPTGAGNVTCNFRQDGKVVKVEKFNTDAECKAWTLKEAKERGLIPA